MGLVSQVVQSDMQVTIYEVYPAILQASGSLDILLLSKLGNI